MSPLFIKKELVQNRFKNILQILIFLIFNSFFAQNTQQKPNENKETQNVVSKSDTIKVQEEQLEDVLRTKADKERSDIPKRMMYLIKNAQVKYQDIP